MEYNISYARKRRNRKRTADSTVRRGTDSTFRSVRCSAGQMATTWCTAEDASALDSITTDECEVGFGQSHDGYFHAVGFGQSHRMYPCEQTVKQIQ